MLCAMISLSLIAFFDRRLQYLRCNRARNGRTAAAVLDENDEGIRRSFIAQEAGEPCVRRLICADLGGTRLGTDIHARETILTVGLDDVVVHHIRDGTGGLFVNQLRRPDSKCRLIVVDFSIRRGTAALAAVGDRAHILEHNRYLTLTDTRPLGSISVLCAMISLSLITLFYRSLQHLRSHRTGNRRAAAAVLDENDESIRRRLVAQEAGEPCVR